MLKRLTISIFIVMLAVCGAVAFLPEPTTGTGLFVGNIYTTISDNVTVLLVDKATENLFVVDMANKRPNVKKVFNVFTGKIPGDKQEEGDLKTPEGIYFIQKFIESGSLNNMLFGDGAFTLNYPNAVDRNYGKTGYGIWIHGRGEDRQDERTKGCVSLNNTDLNLLKDHIKLQTPVVISHKIDFLKPSVYILEKKKYLSLFNDYVLALKNKNYNAFKEFFDESFKDISGHNLENYLNHTKDLMAYEPQSKIHLDVSGLTVFKENSSELMYQYKAFFCAKDEINVGTRKLYLHKDDRHSDYKIVAEEFEEFKEDGNIESLLATHVNKMLSRWRQSWFDKDIKKYMSFYSEKFRSKSMNRARWKFYKTKIFENTTIKDIQFNDISVKYNGKSKALLVTFKQHYVSDKVDDNGIKTLVIEGCPGSFKIKSERWSRL